MCGVGQVVCVGGRLWGWSSSEGQQAGGQVTIRSISPQGSLGNPSDSGKHGQTHQTGTHCRSLWNTGTSNSNVEIMKHLWLCVCFINISHYTALLNTGLLLINYSLLRLASNGETFMQLVAGCKLHATSFLCNLSYMEQLKNNQKS